MLKVSAYRQELIKLELSEFTHYLPKEHFSEDKNTHREYTVTRILAKTNNFNTKDEDDYYFAGKGYKISSKWIFPHKSRRYDDVMGSFKTNEIMT
jgi:hypothetical protein